MSDRTRSWMTASVTASLLGAATAASAQQAAPTAPTPAPQTQVTIGTEPGQRLAPPLDLRAPAVTQVFSPAALQLMLVEQEEANDEPVDVRVQSPRAAPDVPRGMFRAIPWAIMHPTQSWRVLTPLTD
jgi:hypothetical protein